MRVILGTKQLVAMMIVICPHIPSSRLKEELLAAISEPITNTPALKNWKMVCFTISTLWNSVSV